MQHSSSGQGSILAVSRRGTGPSSRRPGCPISASIRRPRCRGKTAAVRSRSARGNHCRHHRGQRRGRSTATKLWSRRGTRGVAIEGGCRRGSGRLSSPARRSAFLSVRSLSGFTGLRHRDAERRRRRSRGDRSARPSVHLLRRQRRRRRGGKDSRLVLAGAVGGGGAAFHYETIGPPILADVPVASELAKEHGLRHDVKLLGLAFSRPYADRVRDFVTATAGLLNPCRPAVLGAATLDAVPPWGQSTRLPLIDGTPQRRHHATCSRSMRAMRGRR
jgi:hypothetical protein